MNYATLERNQCNSKQVSNYMMHAVKSWKYENYCVDQLCWTTRLTYCDLKLNQMAKINTLMMHEYNNKNISEKGFKMKKICTPEDA